MRWQCIICIESEARKLKGVDNHSFGKFITIRAKKKKKIIIIIIIIKRF